MRIQDQELTDRLILGIVGALQGFVIWTLLEFGADGLTTAAFSGVLTFILVSGAIIHFVWTGRQNPRLLTIATLVGVIYAVIAFWVALQIPENSDMAIVARGDQQRVGTWIVASLFSLYVLGPFLQIYQRTSVARFPYRDLFVYSWSNFHIALVGLLFVAVLWAVLGLWAALFRLLDIQFFADLFSEEIFVWTVSGGAIGVGLSLGREKEKLIATLRNITLSVFGALLPLVAVVALMFIVAMPFAGLETLWDTRRASWILLSWIAYTILFINAVYQDGNESPPYAPLVRYGVEGGLVAMIVFCALSLLGLMLRVDQHGLTPLRYTGLITTVIFAAYVLGYSLSVVRRRTEWLASIRHINLWMAPVLVAVALLLHTPVLDPLQWSARNQYNRLVSGKADADTFDYEYLRFKLGSAGQDKLDRLKALSAHPQLDRIMAGIAEAEQAQFYERAPAKRLVEGDFTLYPQDLEWPPGLIAAIRGVMPNYFVDGAGFQQRSALVIAIDLDNQPGYEYVVFPPMSRFQAYGFRADGSGGWKKFGTYRIAEGPQNTREFDTAVAAGRFETTVTEYRNLIIGEQPFYLAPGN